MKEVEIPNGFEALPGNISVKEYHSGADGKGKKIFGKIGNVFMQGSGLAPRASFLAIVRLNPFGLASRFAAGFINDPNFKPDVVAKAKPKWEKFKKTWRKLGGAVSKLEKQVRLGYKKKPIQRVEDAIRKITKKSKIEGDYSNLTGTEEAIAIAKLVIEASPIFLLSINSIKGIGNPFKPGTGPELDTVPELPQEEAIKTDEEGSPVDPETGATIEADKILGIPKTGFWIGTAVLSVLALTATILGINKYKKGKAKS